MKLPDYFADIVRELAAKSATMRRDFATHHPSAGGNREQLVETFLRGHLPKRFEISTGLVISHNGLFSNQADVLIVDNTYNAPFHGTARNMIWTVESVYALIEVKTSLSLSELRDSITKGQRFKAMPRRFQRIAAPQHIDDSLYIIWTFESPAPDTLKANLLQVLAGIPRNEHPDMIIVPDRLFVRGGQYLELSGHGQTGSEYRRQLESQYPGNRLPVPPTFIIHDVGDTALLSFYVILSSWLLRAGSRSPNPIEYLPLELR